MKPLFSENGLKRLRALDPANTLFAFDFDGTLAPIIESPRGSSMPPATALSLRELAKLAHVAVISGRELRDLTPRLKFKPTYAVGNHGLEGLPGGDALVRRAKVISADWQRQIKINFPELARAPGLMVEAKACSLTVHFRHAKQKKRAEAWLYQIGESLQPLPRFVTGKFVLNYIPKGLPHKGEALHRLMKIAGARQAFFIGDDDTDDDVFRMRDPDIFGVRVGYRKVSAARFYVARQTQVVGILSELLKNFTHLPLHSR